MAKLLGKGCTLKLPVSSTQTLIGQLKSFSWTGCEKRNTEVTGLGDQDALFLPTTTDWGTISATVWYDPDLNATTQPFKTIMELAASDAITNGNTAWTITTTDATPTAITGVGIVSVDFIGDASTDSFIEATVTIKVSGKPTWA